MSPFIHLFSDPTIGVIFLTPCVLIVLDILSGIARAIYDREFEYRRLADFLRTSFLQYVIVSATIVAVTESRQFTIAAGTIGQGILSISLLASILENLAIASSKTELAIYHRPTNPLPTVSDFDPTLEMTAVRDRRVAAMQDTDRMPSMEAP
jgi:hypothetical protein